ncbi:MAG: glycoside hydrolase family 28 protein [Deinococcales bacterium]|nr:glycoside hydrolase family 28 protein [Chitinophagaceae bacterium]
MKYTILFAVAIFFGCQILVITAFSQVKLLPVPVPSFKKDTTNIVQFGAKADGVFLNTIAINNAIIACSKKGGGVVLVPAGFWLSGPVVLQNNVNLHLAKNALLQFTADKTQYALISGYWEGLSAARNQSPISANNAVNIAITGAGIVDGNGDAWRAVKKDKLTDSQWRKLLASGGLLTDDKKTWYPSEQALKGSTVKGAGVLSSGKTASDFADIKDFFRPNLVVLTSCKNVLLQGVTFQNSPAWNLHPLMCENLTVKNISVKNPWYAQNGDGIDIESCKNVLVENSTFDVGDDGICIKSGKDEEGRKRGMPTENVTINNCVVYHAHGGFVVGSEMSGGARNINVTNCTFIGTDIGLRFKTTRGRGGVVENIYCNNINMKDIAGEAILFDMYYMAKDPVPMAGEIRDTPKVELLPVTDATPQFRNFVVKNIVCDGAEKGLFIRGLPEMNIKNISLENLVLKAKKGIICEEATGISLKNVQLIVSDTKPVVSIANSQNITINKLVHNNVAEVLFSVKGDRTNGIIITNTNVSNATIKTEFTSGATDKALTIK